MTALTTTRLTTSTSLPTRRTSLTPSLTDSLTITSRTPACPAARLTARLTHYGDDGLDHYL